MRIIDLTPRGGKIFAYGWAKKWVIYDNLEEALADGVKREDIKYWRDTQDCPNWEGKWMITDDKFIPDYYNYEKKEMVYAFDDKGEKIPTSGCVIQMMQYRKNQKKFGYYGDAYDGKYDMFITCVTMGSYLSKYITTFKKASIWTFGLPTNRGVLGNPYIITVRKRKVVAAILSPDSPHYGSPVAAVMEYYPSMRSKTPLYRQRVVMEFFNEYWFKKLLEKKGFLFMVNKQLQAALLKNGIDWDFVAQKLREGLETASPDKGLPRLISDTIDILKANDEELTDNPVNGAIVMSNAAIKKIEGKREMDELDELLNESIVTEPVSNEEMIDLKDYPDGYTASDEEVEEKIDDER